MIIPGLFFVFGRNKYFLKRVAEIALLRREKY